jgi:hypothetical protein
VEHGVVVGEHEHCLDAMVSIFEMSVTLSGMHTDEECDG